MPPFHLTAQRIDDDASVHDRLLWAIHLSGLDDLLLFLASSPADISEHLPCARLSDDSGKQRNEVLALKALMFL